MIFEKQNSNQKADSATGVRGRADLSAASRLQDQRQGAVIEDRYVPLSSGELIEGPTAVHFESPDLESKQADVGSFLISLHYQGCYRVSNNSDLFGQIKKVGRRWHAEIRFADSGDLKQYAGIWATKKEAVEEVKSIIEWR